MTFRIGVRDYVRLAAKIVALDSGLNVVCALVARPHRFDQVIQAHIHCPLSYKTFQTLRISENHLSCFRTPNLALSHQESFGFRASGLAAMGD